jgi:membrane protein
MRFNNRLGTQFGAAITYFSVLALVPLMLLAFSIIGFVLTVARPDLLDDVVEIVGDSLGGFDPETHDKIVALITDTLSNWQAIGLVGLLAAAYSGAGWMGKLKNAVRAASRPDFDLRASQGNYAKKTVVNLGLLFALFLLIVATFALAWLSTTLSDEVVALLGLTEVSWLQPVLRFLPFLLSIGVGWVLFMFIYTVLPEEREPWPIIRRGALLGAVGLAVLQYSTGLLFNLFSANKAASIFGPVIVLMLVFNLFSMLIVFGAAWIGTAHHEAIPPPEERVRFVLQPPKTVDEPGPALVRQEVAARTVRVGMGAGYVTGAATGVGLGAALAWLVSKITRRG